MTTLSKTVSDGFEAKEARHRGVRLHYEVGGVGRPVVLVHGLGGTAANWRLVAPELARRRRVIVPDLPGHGDSGPLSGLPAGTAPTLAAYAEAVLAVLRAEDALPAPWVGHSLGGVIGLRAALLHPDDVQGIVLAAAAGISSATRNARAVVAALGVLRPGRLAARRPQTFAHTSRGRTLAFGWWGVADPVGLAPEMAEAFLSGPPRHTDLRSAGRALVAGDARTDLDGVACPVLCLWGGEDNWVPLEDGMEYARRLGAPLRVIADCGHLLIGERPDAIVAAVEAFLSTLDA